MSEVKVNKISPRTNCGTVQLGDSGDTITIPAGATITNNGTQTGFGREGSVNWQTGSLKTSTFTAVSGEGYFINQGSAITANLPAGSAGAIVAFSDYARNFATNKLTISPNGSEKIGGVAADLDLTVNGQALTLVYIDSTKGWINVQNAEDTEEGIVNDISPISPVLPDTVFQTLLEEREQKLFLGIDWNNPEHLIFIILALAILSIAALIYAVSRKPKTKNDEDTIQNREQSKTILNRPQSITTEINEEQSYKGPTVKEMAKFEGDKTFIANMCISKPKIISSMFSEWIANDEEQGTTKVVRSLISVDEKLINILKPYMSSNIYEIINAASSKPFGFLPFYPGPGYGGHCIPIDPFYLSWRSKQFGYDPKFIELSGKINSGMPKRIAIKVTQLLKKNQKNKILILGVAYKKNVDDIRESPAIQIINYLSKNKKNMLSFYDPYINKISTRNKIFSKCQFFKLNFKKLKLFDVIIIVTDHDILDYEKIYKNSKLIVDCRGRYHKNKNDNIIKL